LLVVLACLWCLLACVRSWCLVYTFTPSSLFSAARLPNKAHQQSGSTVERIATTHPGSPPRHPMARTDADGLAGKPTSASSAPMKSRTTAGRALAGRHRHPSVPALHDQEQGRTHTVFGAARASTGDTGLTRRRSQRWTSIHQASIRLRSPAADGQANVRGVPPAPAQDVATPVHLGLRMRTRPRRFSIAHPRRPTYSLLSCQDATRLSHREGVICNGQVTKELVRMLRQAVDAEHCRKRPELETCTAEVEAKLTSAATVEAKHYWKRQAFRLAANRLSGLQACHKLSDLQLEAASFQACSWKRQAFRLAVVHPST